MFTSGNCSATSNAASCHVECASSSSVPPCAYCASTRVTPAVSWGALVVTSSSIAPSASSFLAASKPCLHHGSLVAHGSTIAVFTLSFPPSAWAPPPPPPPSSSSSPQLAAPMARATAISQMRAPLPDALLITSSRWVRGPGNSRRRSLRADPLPEGDAERRRLGIAPSPDRRRDHHDQRHRVRRRGEDLRRDRRGDSPAHRLDADLERVGEPEQERAAQHEQRVPAPEDHKRDGDPAASRAHVVLEEVELPQHEDRAAHARHAAADQQRRPT